LILAEPGAGDPHVRFDEGRVSRVASVCPPASLTPLVYWMSSTSAGGTVGVQRIILACAIRYRLREPTRLADQLVGAAKRAMG
jgi:hypothetical protein